MCGTGVLSRGMDPSPTARAGHPVGCYTNPDPTEPKHRHPPPCMLKWGVAFLRHIGHTNGQATASVGLADRQTVGNPLASRSQPHPLAGRVKQTRRRLSQKTLTISPVLTNNIRTWDVIVITARAVAWVAAQRRGNTQRAPAPRRRYADLCGLAWVWR
jgi:hypothetical protein